MTKVEHGAQAAQALSSSEPSDALATASAIGAVAYIGETLAHEVVGHGGACLALGGKITAIAPLWMHCSVTTPLLNLAGPAANLALILVFWLILQISRERQDNLRFFAWLSLCFNALVAAGYMGVGGLLGFGDWPATLATIAPAWLVRGGLIALAIVLYIVFLRLAGTALLGVVGLGSISDRRLRHLVLAPTFCAAIVALAAEAVGRATEPSGYALALGCTLGVGLSLTSLLIHRSALPGVVGCAFRVRASLVWIIVALFAAGAFIAGVGLGYDLSPVVTQ